MSFDLSAVGPSQPLLERRTLLRLAAAALPVAAVGVSIPQVASAAPVRPTGTGYVRWEDLYRTGDSFQAVVNKVTNNRILTLPPGTFTFRDFRNGNYDGIRVGDGAAIGCKGIVGSGPTTIIRGVANTATRDKGSRFCGTQLTIARKSGAVLSNFSLRGGPQNGMSYGGICVNNCPDARVSWLYLRGGSRGTSQTPPGETFGINVFASPRVQISDTEVDGRDDAGTRVASSPIGWNKTTDARVIRTYVHHGVAGMLTFWETRNIYTEDFRSFSTGSGSGSLGGHGINHEQASGVIRHIRPQLLVNGVYSGVAGHTGSTSLHMMLVNVWQDVPDVQIIDPTYDRGPGSAGMFCVGMYNGYKMYDGLINKAKTPPYVRKNGVVLQASHHPTSGWDRKDPARYYGVIH